MTGGKLGRWTIDKVLGRGGMGEVFLAHSDGEPSRAAVKVLAPELAREVGFLQRFQREIDALRQLDHPNIVQFYEAGVQDGHYYYAMEFVDGQTFESLLYERHRLPWPEVLEMALQIAPALKHAHDRGIIHRDIKPSNLIRADAPEPGVVKLADFGIVQIFAATHLTETGAVVGTGEYLSPEQAAGKPATRRSDLYSLGVVLYTLLTGRTPFTGKTAADLLHKHIYAQFERPIRLLPELPHDIDDLVCQLLEKDPEKRPNDGGVLYRQLDSIRRKMERKGQVTTVPQLPVSDQKTIRSARTSNREGPATLMSRLMREEIASQNRGSPISRFFNHPLVLVTLLALCVGILVWTFWPTNAESLFQKGAQLMQSGSKDDWVEAWDKYLRPLQEKYPEAHKEEVETYRKQVEDYRARQDALRRRDSAALGSEGKWFYQQGLRLRQQGDEAGARRIWQQLVQAFDGITSEQPWVILAREELQEPRDSTSGNEKRLKAAREALERARELRDQGKRDEAEQIWKALEELYQGDKSAVSILTEVKHDRGT
jgi:serine/threonine-protein kinase